MRLLLVGGSIAANYRNGGIAWERLSWILGLRRLGFEVLAVDQLDESRCVMPPGRSRGYDGNLNVAWCAEVVSRFGLAGDIAVVGDRGESLWGITYDELLERAGEAEALINVAGNVRLGEVKRRVRRRVFVDVDPGFTQLWLASGRAAPRIDGHDVHVTIGENVGTRWSDLPTGGVHWHHTRQPVLLDEWPVALDGGDRLTTVAGWRGSGPHGALDQAFADKADGFLALRDLPRRVPQSVEAVLRGVPREERSLLAARGWRIGDPSEVAAPDDFRAFVQRSGAEISVAKGAYVTTRSGWFSDRTTRYLASGRPAIVHDTAFSRHIPVGEGLFAFTGLDEAVTAAHAIAADYERHRIAARLLAEELFNSDLVLGRLLEDVLGDG